MGRTDELARLQAAVADARADGPRGVVVTGEPGIGKSRLLEELLDRAADDGWTALAGTCRETAGEEPWQPVVDALAATDDPDLRRALDVLTGAALSAGSTSPYATVQAVRSAVLAGARRRPLVLAVDDLQWAAPATVDLLAALGRVRGGRPLLVATAHRAGCGDGPSAALAAYERAARRDARTTLVELAGLRAPDAALLLPDDGTDVTATVRATAGNPLLLELTARAPRHDGALAAHDAGRVVDALLADLPGPVRNVLTLAAVAGRDVPDVVLQAALPGTDLVPLLTSAAEHGLLDRTPTGVRFRHDLLRSALRDTLVAAERRRQHVVVARAVERTAPRLPWSAARVAAELSGHWHEAADPGQALVWALRAADAATAVHAPDEAWHHLAQAVHWWPRADDPSTLTGRRASDVRAAAGRAALAAGFAADAARLFEAALADGTDLPAAERGALWERLGRASWDAGAPAASRAAYAQARAALATVPPAAVHVRVGASQAMSDVQQGRYRDALRLAARTARQGRSLGALDEEGFALNAVGIALTLLGHGAAGTAALERARAHARDVADAVALQRACVNLAYVLERRGRYADALDVARDGLAELDALAVPPRTTTLLLTSAVAQLVRLGRWDEADERTADAFRLGTSDRTAAWLQVAAAQVAVARGRDDRASAALRAAASGADDDPNVLIPLRLVEAEHHLAGGRPAAALTAADDGLARLGPDGDALHCVRLCEVTARARDARDGATPARRGGTPDVHGHGRPRHADLLARVDTAVRRGVGTSSPETAAWHLQVRAACGAEPWDAAVRAWATLAMPHQRAAALLCSAEADLASGHRGRATTSWQQATALATGLGAVPLLERCRALAARARLDTGPAALGDVASTYGLTPRECDVLDLVAQGATNRQVARRLFISERTVAVHVSNVLRKVQVGSRAHLVAVVSGATTTRGTHD